MKDIRLALQVGARRVVAMTCWGCGALQDGGDFERYRRNRRDRQAYIDRRCGACRWQHMVDKRVKLAVTT